MSGTYRTWDEKPYLTDYLLTDAVIEYPVTVVWPHVVQIESWMDAHQIETIAGTRGAEGHLAQVYPRGLEPDTALPHYHLYGIAKLVPFRAVFLEVFPEKGGSYGDIHYPPEHISFDAILLADLKDRTQVTFLMIDVHTQHDDAKKAGFTEMLSGYFENLRRLCASSAA